MRVYTLVNTLTSVSSWVYSNHINFWTQTVRDFPNDKFLFFTPPRMSIDMARNTAAREALRAEADYLLFIDDDVLIPKDSMKRLISYDADIVAGLVIIRGYPFNVMAFKRDGEGLPYFNDLPKENVLVEEGTFQEVFKDPVTQENGLAGVGFSLCLIKCDLLRKVTPPYFVTGPRNTEDVYFCMKAKDQVPDLKISLATSIQCGHFLHAEPIEYRTIDIFKQFYEDLDPAGVERINKPFNNRDLDYVKRNTESL